MVAELDWLLQTITPRAWLTRALVAINVAVFALMVVRGVSITSPTVAQLIAWGASFGPKTLGGEPWRLFTSTFLHAGIIHLGFNMWVLYKTGPRIERIFGAARFGAIYFVAGIAGALASLIVTPSVSLVGASGAIFGIYGAMGAWLFRNRQTLPPAVLRPLQKDTYSVTAMNLLIGFMMPHVGNAAHIGGLVTGGVIGFLLVRPLDLHLPRRSGLGAALVGVAVSVLLVAGIVKALPMPFDQVTALDTFDAENVRLMRAYNQMGQELEEGKLTDAAAADRLEGELLPELHRLQSRVGKPKRWPRELAGLAELMQAYLDATDNWWTEVGRGLRSGKGDGPRFKELRDAQTAAGDRLAAWRPSK